MRKPANFKSTLVVLFILTCFNSIAQTYKPFTVREKVDVRGSMLVIGNNILSKDNLPVNDNVSVNQSINMQYVDIDGDASTFSSSSADLLLSDHQDGSATTCYRVAYAGLYWSAMLKSGESRTNITNIKLKLPGSSTYVNIGGEIIYDAIVNPIVSFNNEAGNTPYACYADITNIISGLSDIEGTYTAADIVSSQGFNNSTGLSAGWSLIVIYEDPELQTKSFTLFDGFSHLFNGQQLVIPVTGFRTPPVGNVDLQFAYGVLEGDKTQKSKLEINGKEVLTPFRRPANNFFRSIIENTNGVSNPRNPMSENTLGYDTGFLEIIKANPSYINNDVTSADFRLQVPLGQADPIYAFFSAFAVDIIAPDIDLTKIVVDTSGNNIDGDDVNLGQRLFYEITYQSVGNDNVTQFTIKDVLPDNIVFNPATDIDLTNAGGATLQSYDPVTRTLIFNIPDSSVEVNDPAFKIRLAVQVVPNCYDLSQACSNEIMNQAFATYRGIINPTVIQDEGSFATTECLGVPGSTNFLVDISNCSFQRTEILCGSNVILTAANGYDSYSWSTSPTGTPVIGTGQSYTATQTGTYYVQNTTSSTCISIQEEITVATYGNNLTNPVIPYADLLPICPNDGKVLPYIFLCGANDSRAITTGISDAVSIIWQQLDENSCPALTVDNCANENDTCTWNQVANGSNYIANTSGQFRLVINYPGGCFNIFYFNVYQNLLNPTITAEDILCTTAGEVTVGGVPSGYEYSLNPNGPYQASNIFSINTPDYYTVYIRQIGVSTNPCTFETPSIYVRQRDFTVSTVVTQPDCHDGKGSISLAANDALPQYYFSIYQGATLINSVGPILASDYTFANLNPGTYTVNVSTDDGCVFSENIDIINPPILTVTAALTRPLTCTDGEITVYPVGGTPPYEYYVNSSTVSQDTPVITVTSAGVYNITVLDFNGCSATTSITVNPIPSPEYTINHIDILCYNSNTGVIQFNVSNANGYTIAYSIDNGVTYGPNATFSNLSSGTYPVNIRYSLNGVECFSAIQNIIITQPNTALTASAGVSELAGCGPSGTGRVRITNPQGGTPPYEYSFDNQATWTTTNEAYVAPGTYTLYIRDANGCIYPMSGITIDPEPIAPTIDVSNPNFNCDGSANATVTVTNSASGSFTYRYLIDGLENTNAADPRIFLDVPSGLHTISVEYTLSTVPTYSNLLMEDFGSGAPTTTSGIASAYCFNDQRVNAPYNCGTRSVEDNQYSVASFFWRSDDPSSNNTGAWYHFRDHTTNGVDPNGRYLLVNIGSAAGPYGILYSKPISDVIPNQAIQVDLYVANLIRASRSGAKPDFIIQLVDGSGNIIAAQNVGEIENNELWNLKSLSLNPGNNTNLTFVIRSGSILYSGNDAVIDDITVYQLPAVCVTTVNFPFIVASGNAFSAQIINTTNPTCSDANDGTVTISAQNFDATKGFQYSIDNGTTWITQMTSPHTITGLAPASYDIQVRYENVINTCVVPLTQTIIAPAPLAVIASGTSVTCFNGSTVTASAIGGSPAYTYELLDTSLNLVANFPSNVLTNVAAGDYTIRATDANGCIATYPLNLADPSPPTATIINADYCYDTTNGASLEVNASGGNPPYQYSINGGVFQSNPIFSNLIPGSYDIIVRDSYGCTFPLPTEIIASQLTATAVLTKGLDCSVTPNAEVNITISGGTGPYTYEVSFNSGAFTSTAAPPYIYNNIETGNYQFRVTDASGCISLTNTIAIQPISNPSATAVVTDVSCNSESSGVVVIDVDETGGTPSYQISFNGSQFTSQTVYNGLTAGTYNYIVRDSNFCEFNGIATVNEPSLITLGSEIITPITCGPSGNIPGSITISNITGGSPNYTYTLLNSSGNLATTSSTNPFGPTPNDNVTFDGLAFGNYYLRVVDGNGCEYNFGPYQVASDVDALNINVDASSANCVTGVDYNINIVNGVGPFRVRIYDGTIAFNPGDGDAPNGLPTSDVSPNERNHQFTGLQFGVSYVFEVLDTSTGCTYIEQVLAEPSPSPMILTGTTSNVTCIGDTNGAFNFIASAYTGALLSWEVFNNLTNTTTGITGSVAGLSGADFSDTVVGLESGDYYLLVTETDPSSTECTAFINFRITEPTELLLAEVVNTNANCNQGAQVVVNGSGGTPPYEYAFVEDGVIPNVSDWTTNNLAFLDYNVNTSWDVYIRDSNGCAIVTPMGVTIATDPLPSVTLPTLADDQCTSSGNSYTFTATPGGGEVTPVSYSIDGVNFQSSPIFVVSSSGTYTVTIRDGNGCIATDTIIVYPPLGLTPTVTTLPSCDDNDGVITVNTIGGSGSYTYAISPNVGSISGSVISGVPSGTYTITVTDTNTLCSKDVPVTLEAATLVTFTTTPTNVSCNGGSDGMITVNLPASNDNPIYTYSLDGGVTTQTSNVFTGLAQGTYNITVTSGKNCSLTQQQTVDEPNPFTVPAPVIVDYSCTVGTNTTNYATITVNGVTGGSGTYTRYEFIRGGTTVQSGANNAFTETDFLGGNYTINVYDNNSCLGTTTVTILPFISLEDLNVTIDNAITCTNDENITVSVISTGGIPTNLEYTLVDFAGVMPTQTNTTGVFTALPVGNYIITVANLDTGCSLQTVHYINEPNTFDLTIDSVIDVTCFSDSDGSVNVTFIDRVPTPTDESGSFSYNVTDSLGNPITSGTAPIAGPITLSGLASGTYTITAILTNAPFCTVSKNFTITAPTAALAIAETHSDITCVSDYNDGTISASSTGGWPGGYEYRLERNGIEIVPFSSISQFSNLSEGDYVVTVRDSRNCEVSTPVTLTIPAPITATVTADTTLLSCFGDTGATVTASAVSGGQGSNYTYTLNMLSPIVTSSGPQTSPIFSGLGAGTYNVTITDGYNCEFTSPNITIDQPTEVQALLVRETSPTCTTDATLTLSATGGTGTYEYSGTATFATILGSFTSSTAPIPVPPGTYMYYVRDANGCIATVSNEIAVDPLPALTINLDVTNAAINCTGDNTAVIVAVAQGGLGSYIYTLLDSGGNPIPTAAQDSPGVFTGLTAGTYQVRVDSGDCLTISAPITITEPAAPLTASFLPTDPTCFGSGDGMLEIVASGGTGIIKYAISPRMDQFFDTPIFEDLYPGTYQAIAQDELGCFILFDFTITDPDPVQIVLVPGSIQPELCEGDLDGAFSVTVSGGTMPYSYALDDRDGPYITGAPTQAQFDFAGLSGGDHTVYVIDGAGCESEAVIAFPESVSFEPLAVVGYGCDNNLPSNTVTVNVTGNVDQADLTYSLDGGPYQASNLFVDVPSGVGHYVDVMHANGCTQRTQLFDVEQFDPIALALDDGGLNEIVAVTTGGSGVYRYTLNGEDYGSTNTFLIYRSGDYTVTVTDSYGCTASATGYFEYIDVCIPNYFTPVNEGWGPGCTSQYTNLTVDIFDRYGRKIATLRVGDKWDGSYDGKELPTGDYWYVVKLNDPKDDRDFVGHFTLYR